MFAALLALACFTIAPVSGPVINDYAPLGRFAGHWGVDIATPVGTEVRAPIDGVVSFAGMVAGMSTVTLRSDDGARISMSYLSAVEVKSRTRASAGDVIGLSGRAHGRPALHVSVRVSGVYTDPAMFLNCAAGTIRLLPDR